MRVLALASALLLTAASPSIDAGRSVPSGPRRDVANSNHVQCLKTAEPWRPGDPVKPQTLAKLPPARTHLAVLRGGGVRDCPSLAIEASH